MQTTAILRHTYCDTRPLLRARDIYGSPLSGDTWYHGWDLWCQVKSEFLIHGLEGVTCLRSSEQHRQRWDSLWNALILMQDILRMHCVYHPTRLVIRDFLIHVVQKVRKDLSLGKEKWCEVVAAAEDQLVSMTHDTLRPEDLRITLRGCEWCEVAEKDGDYLPKEALDYEYMAHAIMIIPCSSTRQRWNRLYTFYWGAPIDKSLPFPSFYA